MIGNYNFHCKCGAIIEIPYDVGEHFADLPLECDECGRELDSKDIDSIYNNAEQDIIAGYADSLERDE